MCCWLRSLTPEEEEETADLSLVDKVGPWALVTSGAADGLLTALLGTSAPL